jgi:hypothetical protein
MDPNALLNHDKYKLLNFNIGIKQESNTRKQASRKLIRDNDLTRASINFLYRSKEFSSL